MKKIKSKSFRSVLGTFVGLVNGFFGAGGGLLCIPLLMGVGMDRKNAHANAIAVIWPITLVSATIYLLKGRIDIESSLIYLPGGIIGSIVGTYIMKKISPNIIRHLFGIFMLWAGWRLMF